MNDTVTNTTTPVGYRPPPPGVTKEDVDWNAVDGNPVHILFTVLRPERATDEHDPEEHIKRMSWIARLGREADFRRFVRSAKTKAEMLSLLKEMSAV